MTWQRSRIRLDGDNTAFWTGGAEGLLNIHKCADCGGFTHPPREFCRHCQSDNVGPHAVSGAGVIDTYTVNHQKWAADMEVPFVIARVRLDDAPDVCLTTNIVNCPVDSVDIGDRVRVVFEDQDGIWYPLFEKVE
ncbi:MAG: OB-fold domain-containing protein [Blastomonas sp.]|uniref:Zn-ribbon domain-containing OB-fold protein n=1 Tax=Blastomonas sp. TaxID=1909299 RepID=UPI00258BC7D2|nr:OB-fold domain-containing protein [Blastomonas sp.]MCO5793835.1 OB-fold domain-containing protein [Blastomonas sp.]